LLVTGYGSAVTPDGKHLLVALPDANKVALIDLLTMQVTRNIDVPAYPQEVLITPDGHTAYVSCMHANQVAVIDVGSGKAMKTIDTGKDTDGLAWAVGGQ
jgi:YVTN family beta-propeller protein